MLVPQHDFHTKGRLPDERLDADGVPMYSDGLVSPRRKNAWGTPRPSYPSDNDGKFMAELEEVVVVREKVVTGVWPHEFLEKYYTGKAPVEMPAPLARAGVHISNPQGAASLVRMDLPSDLGEYIFDWLAAELPKDASGHDEFVDGKVLFMTMLWANIYKALSRAFEVKYYWNRIRPEQATYMPGCLFTAYVPEGCPKHPAYVAGHAAVAGATYATLLAFFRSLPDSLRQIAHYACYLFAQFRTFAGVHYASDNIVGLELGENAVTH